MSTTANNETPKGFIYLHPSEGFTFLENVPEKPNYENFLIHENYRLAVKDYERALAEAIEKRMVIGNPEVLKGCMTIMPVTGFLFPIEFKVGELYPWPHEYDILESLPPKVLLVIPKAEPVNSSMSYSEERKRQVFAQLKHEVGSLLTQKFLEYNEGKFHTALELNPAVHALTELIFTKLKPEPVVSQDQEERMLKHVLSNAYDGLRLAANILESRSRKTAADRQIEFAERLVSWYKDGRVGDCPSWIPKK